MFAPSGHARGVHRSFFVGPHHDAVELGELTLERVSDGVGGSDMRQIVPGGLAKVHSTRSLLIDG